MAFRSTTGLTEGLSSKVMRGNRSTLLPSLMMMHQNGERVDVLHGRLDELLVFEILKDGGTSYRQFTVRTLYKYVLKAVKTEARAGNTPSNRKLMDHLALGRAIIRKASFSFDGLIGTIDETMPIIAPLHDNPSPEKTDAVGEEAAGESAQVTWRERLGGYLHPRDMRKLVTPFSASNEPELIVRRHAMLLNFDPLRAIILRDRLIVLVPDGADSLLVQLERRIRGDSHIMFSDTHSSSMIESDSSPSLNKLDTAAPTDENGTADEADSTVGLDLEEELESSFFDNEWAELEGKEWIDLPFELQGVDAVLSSVSSILADDVNDLQLGANSIIADLVHPNSDAGDHAQESLRTMKNAVREMTSRVSGFNRAIDALLEDYEDMALMNLSRLLSHPERFIQPVAQAVLEEESDEPELILEAHLQRGHTLVNALMLVEGQISSTEDFAERRSDTIRNRLLYINMVISILSLSIAMGSLVGSIFGMNVINFYEESENAFSIIVWSTIGGIMIFVISASCVLGRLVGLPNVFKRPETK